MSFEIGFSSLEQLCNKGRTAIKRNTLKYFFIEIVVSSLMKLVWLNDYYFEYLVTRCFLNRLKKKVR